MVGYLDCRWVDWKVVMLAVVMGMKKVVQLAVLMVYLMAGNKVIHPK